MHPDSLQSSTDADPSCTATFNSCIKDSYLTIVRFKGSNLGLKFGLESPIRVLSSRFADSKIHKQTNYYKFIPYFV